LTATTPTSISLVIRFTPTSDAVLSFDYSVSGDGVGMIYDNNGIFLAENVSNTTSTISGVTVKGGEEYILTFEAESVMGDNAVLYIDNLIIK